MKTFNEELRNLRKDVKKIKEKVDDYFSEYSVNDEYFELFNAIKELNSAFEDIDVEEEIHTVEIIFEANGSNEDLRTMYSNLDEYYTEFTNDNSKEEYVKKDGRHHCHFYGTWVGNIDECRRFTHHAEGLYENTGLEHVHVEVCIDGEWFGR